MLSRLYNATASLFITSSRSTGAFFSTSTSSSSTIQANMTVKDTVESAIAENHITIFSKSWCPFSESSKKLFATKYPNAQVKVLEIDELPEEQEIQDYLMSKTGIRSVPNIFIGQKHIGGNDVVTALERQGKLAELVSA